MWARSQTDLEFLDKFSYNFPSLDFHLNPSDWSRVGFLSVCPLLQLLNRLTDLNETWLTPAAMADVLRTSKQVRGKCLLIIARYRHVVEVVTLPVIIYR